MTPLRLLVVSWCLTPLLVSFVAVSANEGGGNEVAGALAAAGRGNLWRKHWKHHKGRPTRLGKPKWQQRQEERAEYLKLQPVPQSPGLGRPKTYDERLVEAVKSDLQSLVWGKF